MRNEVMHHPVVKEELSGFMRIQQKKLPGELGKLEEETRVAEVPVIPHEVVIFLKFLLGWLQPERILETGATIGFSSSVTATTIGKNAHVTTIDRFDVMIKEAKKNCERLGLTDKVTLLKGQAADIPPELFGSYDFIFMDSAKSKYIELLPECLRSLRKDGILMVDDIFQEGTILSPGEEIPRGKWAIHRKLNEFLRAAMNHPDLTSTILSLGDGVILMAEESETVGLRCMIMAACR